MDFYGEMHLPLVYLENLGSTSKNRKSKNDAKGAGVDDSHMEEFRETMVETKDEQMWGSVDDGDDGVTDDQKFDDDEISLEREGSTYLLFKEKYMDEARKHLGKQVKGVYDEIKQYKYRYIKLARSINSSTFLHLLTLNDISLILLFCNLSDSKCIYPLVFE